VRTSATRADMLCALSVLGHNGNLNSNPDGNIGTLLLYGTLFNDIGPLM